MMLASYSSQNPHFEPNTDENFVYLKYIIVVIIIIAATHQERDRDTKKTLLHQIIYLQTKKTEKNKLKFKNCLRVDKAVTISRQFFVYTMQNSFLMPFFALFQVH